MQFAWSMSTVFLEHGIYRKCQMNDLIVDRLHYLLQLDSEINDKMFLGDLVTIHRIRSFYKIVAAKDYHINCEYVIDDFNETGSKIAEDCIVRLMKSRPHSLLSIILGIKRHSNKITKLIYEILRTSGYDGRTILACVIYLSRFEKHFMLDDFINKIRLAIDYFDIDSRISDSDKRLALIWLYKIGDDKFRNQLCRRNWSKIADSSSLSDDTASLSDKQILIWEARFLMDAVSYVRSYDASIKYLKWILNLLHLTHITYKMVTILYEAIKTLVYRQHNASLRSKLISLAIHPDNPEIINRRLLKLYDKVGDGFNARYIIMSCDFTSLGIKLFKHYLAKGFLNMDDVISLLDWVYDRSSKSISFRSYMPEFKNKFYLTAIKYLIIQQKDISGIYNAVVERLMLKDKDFSKLAVENGLVDYLS